MKKQYGAGVCMCVHACPCVQLVLIDLKACGSHPLRFVHVSGVLELRVTRSCIA